MELGPSTNSILELLMTHKILKMISDAEDDGRGAIEYDEFLRMMTHMILNRDPKDKMMTHKNNAPAKAYSGL